MGRIGTTFCASILLLIVLASTAVLQGLAQPANTPPRIDEATVEKTILYRGLQTLRGTVSASDNETPNRCARAITGVRCLQPRYLKVEATITFSDFQSLRVPLVQPLDSRFNPTGPFALTVVIPESVGTGGATLTLTVTDEGGLTNSTQFTLVILDHRPVVETRSTALLTLSSASAVVAGAAGLGANVSSADRLLADAQESFELGDVNLFSLEEVDAAVALYREASSRARLAIDAAQASARAYASARDARAGALAALEAATKQVALAKALGADVKQAEDLLKQASGAIGEGDRLLALEGSPGAASAYARASALAGFASDLAGELVKRLVDARNAEAALQAEITAVRLQLLRVRAELGSAAAYLAGLRAVGVDVSPAESLLKWASDALAKVEGELAAPTLASAKQRAGEISEAIRRARDLATSAATKLYDDLSARAREALGAAGGLLYTPDQGFARGLIDSAADFRDAGELAAAIDRLKMAIAEAGRLQAISLLYNTIILATILVILLAIILGVALLRARRPTQ